MRFSEFFKLNRSQAYLDFVDIPLETDIPVFLDPGAIKSLNSVWGHELTYYLQNYFEVVLKLIRAGDNARAQKLLSSLNERNEFHLGYSTGKSRGHGFGAGSAKSVWNALTKSKAISTGLLKDLEDTALLIEGIGSDMISDAVSNILRGPLIKYTQDICRNYGVQLTPNIDSGPIWDPQKEDWYSTLLPLPVTDHGKIILVPKILVRHRLTFQYDQYHRHYLLPEMQDEHLSSNSSLVEVLKDGTRRVTKESLMKKYGRDKLSVIEQTIKRPDVYNDYKKHKLSNPSAPLSHEDFNELENEAKKLDITPLLKEMKSISSGAKQASEYEDVIEKIFSAIFYPSLCHPIKQHEIHNGRKRVDITYINESKIGFFNWLSQHYICPMIFIECKNYTAEIANPELDQLSGRFSRNRGQVGILVCRKIENKKLFNQRCIDTANDGRGFILALDDDDIEKICNEYINDTTCSYNFLRKSWIHLIS
ncbi:hypothetical protein WFP47_03555 [Yersinia enterocolitica]|uniref:hypothetical protein n=1 Tax=Yersinia mollaretii TaxID=33060 RepID=UPI000C1594B6|nr:hypothetical protein [Yersinia mollaretii]MDA5527292.1 hypothetical protein [Yersinia mollaretii]MDR7874468.1 hypothetical protein [Yersinia mollaretii]PHZ29682.1 hypothetical protein CS537_21305 [Yersinia mollaretii]WQC74072.1 hypothetical protein U1Z61_16770 [Yersinia mollaretii]